MKVLNSNSVVYAAVLLSDLSNGLSLFGNKKPQLTKRDGSEIDNFIKFKFDKSYGDSYKNSSKRNKPKLDIVKRDGYEEIELKNESSFYSIKLSIGTPAQNVTVLIDTGSSDLWVTGSDNPLCSSDDATFTGSDGSSQSSIDCSLYGTFDIDDSSSFTSNDTSFAITYGDGSYALGNWGQDVLSLQDIDVTGLSFAVANYTNSTVGVLGIGLPSLEATYSGSLAGSNPYQYDNLPLVLRNSGAVKSYAYSLFLNDEDSSEGSILFGGVDHSKYEGTLNTLPLVNYQKSSGFQSPYEFDITLQGLGISTSSKNTTVSDTQIVALLDSGTTLTYLPVTLTSLLAAELNASYSARLGYYTMSCPSSSDSTEIVFDFGGFHINVPLTSFIVTSSMNVCILGIIPRSGDQAILGDSFLQHAYVVYDLENLEISLAQAKYGSSSEDIEAIVSSVPSAVRAASYSNTWSTAATINSGGDIFTVSTTASNGTTSSGSSTRSSTSSRRTGTATSSSTGSAKDSSASSLRPSSSTIDSVSGSSGSSSSTSSTSISNSATTLASTTRSSSTSSSLSTSTSSSRTSSSNSNSNGSNIIVPSFITILASLFYFI
ncbi:hypothetical protein TPHA_0A01580 [Tetrapisispora phaffii CBS 4417]|uniref:Peptidase A1 domain-containing protein n=1 Tax=Tetrapisispora phaffii (strain ATCC 24235 / CBS 4417 / NBRC 1672 / NRRL Y-8282 / UCD 70-5) TaxID=1071381 RepID=G8BMW3_TETPH|nr:hypothetical protein TPHA_0A01580 [Tetrapisispora phaffii CBS 4417]CCE61241.1 hypothetical protein TPHA_0A01580 [Tetrapisispora phaffii CBS 4417]